MNLRQPAAELPSMPALIEWGEAYEALLALAMFTGDEPEDSYEVGPEWFKGARRRASPRLKEAVRQLLGGTGGRWFLLLGLVHEAGDRRDLEALLARLRALTATDVLLALLGGRLPRLRLENGRRLVELALAGDQKAAAAVAARTQPGERSVVQRLAALGPEAAKALTIEILERWRDEVFGADRETWLRSIEADFEARSKLAGRLTAAQLVERVTGGIEYRGEAGIDQVVLLPTAASRPWIVTCEWDSTKLFCYPAIAREAAGQEERDVAAVYRALSDETRLRILRELTAGDRRIADLAHQLGLAKSTIHSHLAILRSSGLVRVAIGADKLYGLCSAKPDLNQLLDQYLRR